MLGHLDTTGTDEAAASSLSKGATAATGREGGAMTIMRALPRRLFVAHALLALLLAGCAGSSQQGASQATPANTVATTVPATAAQAGPSPTRAATPVPTVSGAASPTTTSRPQTATSPPAAASPAIAQASTPAPAVAGAAPTPTLPARCEPTRADALGPFYEPNAPRRTSVGQGYVLTGVVRSANGCAPIPGALVEFWMANPQGEYDDDHRATMQAGAQGDYRFESNVPVPYGGRPPHIHVKVTAPGYRELVTQHYPQPGQTQATFDLVLSPQ